MLDEGVIGLVEEYAWIIPMVVQDKKTIGEVHILAKLIKLNDSCLHDPFFTQFIDELLESVHGQ